MMKKLILNLLIVVSFIISYVVIFQLVKLAAAINKTRFLKEPFQKINSQSKLKVVFMGDSTAYGTGVDNNLQSVAGYFAQDFPEASIENYAKNGLKLNGLLKNFPQTQFQHYDLLVFQIGGNDILKFTAYKNIKEDLSKLVEIAQNLADHVVVLHSGNVGLAPIFSWPFNDLLTERSRIVREIYLEQTKSNRVYYVDLFQEKSQDVFLQDIKKYYSPDLLHPSGEGYRVWYNKLRETLVRNNVKF